MPHKTAFVLPPFATDYPGNPFEHIPGFDEHFRKLLSISAAHSDPDLLAFDYLTNNFLDDELKSQYIAYILACSISDYLKKSNLVPDIYAGYSMGLYAALCLSETISFEHGLDIIRYAFENIRDLLPSGNYAMCSIIGLSKEDLHQIFINNRLGPEIAIQNSVCSFLLSGKAGEIEKTMELAREEGAINTRLLNVSVPYHSHFLRQVNNTLGKHLSQVTFRSPSKPVISLIDQRVIYEEYEIRREIIRNIYTPLNWYKTQIALHNAGYQFFVECGPGKALVKNSRFIEGDAIFVNANAFYAMHHD